MKRTCKLNDPLRRIFKVNNEVYNFSRRMNAKVLKILERYELDKPILMQDKLDMIWDKPEGKEPKSLLPEAKQGRDDSRLSQTAREEQKSNRKPQNMDHRVVEQKLKIRKIERKHINQ